MSLRLFSWPDLHGAEFLMHDVRQVVVFLLTLHHLLVQANSSMCAHVLIGQQVLPHLKLLYCKHEVEQF